MASIFQNIELKNNFFILIDKEIAIIGVPTSVPPVTIREQLLGTWFL